MTASGAFLYLLPELLSWSKIIWYNIFTKIKKV